MKGRTTVPCGFLAHCKLFTKWGEDVKNPTFYQITDLHLYAGERIGSFGEAYDRKAQNDQKCMKESVAIVQAAFDAMAADKETEVILISGDLTFDGEKASHDLLVEMLTQLKKSGKRIFVTTATHDYRMNARGYNDHGAYPVEKYPREELREIYAEFGWNEAVAEHPASMSYAVKLFPGWRCLLMNDDGPEGYCGYSDDLLKWVKDQAVAAKADGERVIAVTHHPMLPPAKIYPLFSHGQMLSGYETTAPMFADFGIEYVFTGHTHMQSISHLDTIRGGRIYHINTGSVTGHPAPYRKMTITPEGIDVKTLNVTAFDWDLDGKSVDEYMKDHFLFMLRTIFDTMENDHEAFKRIGASFAVNEKAVDMLGPLLTLFGKIVNGLTFGGLAKLLLMPRTVQPSVKDVKVKEFLLDLISDLYSGKREFTPDTAVYRSFMPMARRLGKLVRLSDYYGNRVYLEDLFEDLMTNVKEEDNTNAFLPFVSKR